MSTRTAWILGLIAATAITLFAGTQVFLSQIRGMASGTIHVTKPDGTFAEAVANQISFDFSGPMPVLTITPTAAGGSGMLNCTDFGPGVCDFVIPALARNAIDWQGAQTFEQFLTLKAIPSPALPNGPIPGSLPQPGFARVYYGLDHKLHLQDETGLDRTFP